MVHSMNGGEEQSVGKVMGNGDMIEERRVGKGKGEHWVQEVLLNIHGISSESSINARPAREYLLLRNCNNVSTDLFGTKPQSNSLSISPALTSSEMAFGLRPSTWQPVEKAVPRISKTVPFKSLAIDLCLILRAISTISSRGIDLVCLMFFSFLRSRGGSFRALMTREEADGTTETAA